jgi:exonuclease III
MQVGQNLPADGPHVRLETRNVRQEVPDDPGEIDRVPQELRHFCREKKTGENTMKLLTWNACRLLAGGRELALVNILMSSGADVATITECKIPEGSGEFSMAGYTTFSPPPKAGGKTRVLVLVKKDLAVRANVKVMTDIMDPAIQSVWLHFNHHKIGSATLGAFILGVIYREWTPLLSCKESKLCLGSLLNQISKATEHGSRVAIHGDFNVDLDRGEDRTYYMATLAK